MPARTEDYEVLLDFVNDTHDCATVQLLRDYGRNTGAIVLLHPGERVTLVLDAGQSVHARCRMRYCPLTSNLGSIYQYALKTRSKVVNVTCEIMLQSAFRVPLTFYPVHDRGETLIARCRNSFLEAYHHPQVVHGDQ